MKTTFRESVAFSRCKRDLWAAGHEQQLFRRYKKYGGFGLGQAEFRWPRIACFNDTKYATRFQDAETFN